MSLHEALSDLADQMDEEAKETVDDLIYTMVASLLRRYARQIRTLVKAAGDAPAQAATPFAVPGTFTSPTAQREHYVELAKQEMRRAKSRAEGQDSYEQRMIMCVGGPADGTYASIPQGEIPEGSRCCFVAGAKYRISDDNKQLEFVTPESDKGAGTILLG